jgi:hypothetical protein
MVQHCPSGPPSLQSVLFREQSQQKSDILKELNISDHKNLILISHSIGARMMLDMMNENVKLGIGLMPTVEHMAITAQG